MTKGIMVDLHGTLVDSNRAWSEAFQELDPANAVFYECEIWKKRSRHELARIAQTEFRIVLDLYKAKLKPREEIVNLVMCLAKEYPLILVSNSERQRVIDDLTVVPQVPFQRIYSKEDGKKPRREYLERVLAEMSWESAFMIGNDFEEDGGLSEKITAIIVPHPRLIGTYR